MYKSYYFLCFSLLYWSIFLGLSIFSVISISRLTELGIMEPSTWQQLMYWLMHYQLISSRLMSHEYLPWSTGLRRVLSKSTKSISKWRKYILYSSISILVNWKVDNFKSSHNLSFLTFTINIGFELYRIRGKVFQTSFWEHLNFWDIFESCPYSR